MYSVFRSHWKFFCYRLIAWHCRWTPLPPHSYLYSWNLSLSTHLAFRFVWQKKKICLFILYFHLHHPHHLHQNPNHSICFSCLEKKQQKKLPRNLRRILSKLYQARHQPLSLLIPFLLCIYFMHTCSVFTEWCRMFSSFFLLMVFRLTG